MDIKITIFLFFQSLRSCDLDLGKRSRSFMQIKDINIVYLYCKFSTHILNGVRVMALSFFHTRKIPYLKECVRTTLKGQQSKIVWYGHHHHRWVYQWYDTYLIRRYEHFAGACRKSVCKKSHFFAKTGFNCVCDLDLSSYHHDVFVDN